MKRLVLAILVVLSLAVAVDAQTFRGAINGTVTDPSGAAVPNAQVVAKEKSTGIDHTTVTTSDGQFVFQDISIGAYTVRVTATGFPVLTVDNVLVTQGAIYTLPVKLTLSQQTTTVEVSASALALDTTTETQTTAIGGSDLVAMPLNGRDFSQLVEAVPGFAGYAAGGYGSLNGTRANQMNWQIDGVDNNDLWHNTVHGSDAVVTGIGEKPRRHGRSGAEVGWECNSWHGVRFSPQRSVCGGQPFCRFKERESQLQLRILGRRADP